MRQGLSLLLWKGQYNWPTFFFGFLQRACDAVLQIVPMENLFYGFDLHSRKLHTTCGDYYKNNTIL